MLKVRRGLFPEARRNSAYESTTATVCLGHDTRQALTNLGVVQVSSVRRHNGGGVLLRPGGGFVMKRDVFRIAGKDNLLSTIRR